MQGPHTEPTVESKVIYKGRIVNLRVDTVELHTGRLTTREIAEHGDSVCVVPVDSDGSVLLVRQYRKPAEASLLEIPAGGMDPGESPHDTVLRELQEEIGYTAANIRPLSSFWVSPGWCTEFMYSYLATGLSPAKLAADDDENITVERVPLGDIPMLIQSGEIRDAKSILSLVMALNLVNPG